MEKALTIHPATFDQIRPLLERITVKADHTDGALTLDDACRGAACFVVCVNGGRAVMGYAVKQVGQTCWIVAAGGDMRGRDLVATVAPMIEAQARAAGCHDMAVATNRRGLVCKLLRQGWRDKATIMRKKLK